MATTDTTTDHAAERTLEEPGPSPRADAGGPADRSGHGRWRRRVQLGDVIVVAAPALLALGLCLYQLTTRSLWLDESATVSIASQHGAAFGTALARDGGNMLGYYALLHVLIGWFGNGGAVIRLPSAIAAAATVAVVGMLGLRLFDRRVALAAGLLTAVSLPLVFWGQDARGYTAMVAFVAGSFLILVSLVEAEHTDWRIWLGYVAVTVAAVYAGLEAVLVLPAQLIVLIWYRPRAPRVFSAMAASAVSCIPLAVLAASRGSSQLFWVPRPSFMVVKQVLHALTSSGLQPNFRTSTSDVLLALTLIVLGVGVWLVWRALRAREEAAWRPALVLSWLLVPAAIALLESLVAQPIFQARYLLISLPAVALLLAWTLVRWADLRWRGTVVIAIAAFAALIVLRTVQLTPSYGASPENWRGATSYVLAGARAGDCMVFYPQDARMPFEYYLGTRTTAPPSVLPRVPWTEVRSYVEDYKALSGAALQRLPSACGRVWLVSSHEGRVGGPPVSQQDYARFLALQAGLDHSYHRVRSTNFGYSGAVVVSLLAR